MSLARTPAFQLWTGFSRASRNITWLPACRHVCPALAGQTLLPLSAPPPSPRHASPDRTVDGPPHPRPLSAAAASHPRTLAPMTDTTRLRLCRELPSAPALDA
ncbi:hypothetical protein SVAN01_08710 [Stagonosporopsis vannaccii]|nr:hypothetical protein SVAN01_08710 [Stagonosporopsis vannaccii]